MAVRTGCGVLRPHALPHAPAVQGVRDEHVARRGRRHAVDGQLVKVPALPRAPVVGARAPLSIHQPAREHCAPLVDVHEDRQPHFIGQPDVAHFSVAVTVGLFFIYHQLTKEYVTIC